MNLKGRSFLTLKDFSAEEIGYLLDLAEDLKAKKTSEENTQSDFFILNNDRHNIIANGPISVTLKWGVTNKEIRSVVERIKTQYDPSINYHIENGNMYVDLNADRTETMTGCLMELSKLGKIYV